MADRVLRVIDQQVRVSVAGGPLLAALAGQAALPFAERAEAALAQIEDIAANAEDAPSVINKVDKSENGGDFADLEAVVQNLKFKNVGTGAVARALEPFLRELAVSVNDYLGIGESISVDAGPAIRRALATGRPVRFPPATYIVEPDPDSLLGAHLSACIQVPSNATLFFDAGALIKAADGVKAWCRTVVFGGNAVGVWAENVRCYGLNVDANVANIDAEENEHMHGVYLYNLRDSYFDSIRSVNARGDNVFIGGDVNTRGSHNNVIGSIYARTAGRKSFVMGASDSNVIDSVDVDNRLGGWTGSALAGAGGGVDIEPDAVDGTARNENWIGTVISRGCGDDFTAGTSMAQADSYHLNIRDYDLEVTPFAGTPAWIQYGITLNIGRLRISGQTGVEAESNLQYSARLNVEEMVLEGGRQGWMMVFSRVGSEMPKVRIGTLRLENTASDYADGIENRGGDLIINRVLASTPFGTALWNRSTGAGLKASMCVTSAEFRDTGHTGRASSVVQTTGAAGDTVTEFLSIRQIDGRESKAGLIFDVGAGSADGLTIGAVTKESATALAVYAGADKYHRTPSRTYVCTGSPEAMIAAPVGSMASRTDGGAGTSFYVKESGSGSSGWVAK